MSTVNLNAIATSINNIPRSLSKLPNLLPNLLLRQRLRLHILPLHLNRTTRRVLVPSLLQIIRVTRPSQIPKLLKHVTPLGVNGIVDLSPALDLLWGGDAR